MTRNINSYTKVFLLIAFVALLPQYINAEESHGFYFMEVGVQGGASYYIGELAPHVFMSTAESYGAQARVKFDPRWALQLKGQRQRVLNNVDVGNEWGIKPGMYKHSMWHVDIVGEYNFFQLGLDEYNISMKPVTPFMFVGFGVTIHDLKQRQYNERIGERPLVPLSLYIPLGIGVKWKFAERWQLQMAWQHNVYVWNGDGLEGIVDDKCPNLLNNSYEMNGTNIMNNDVASSLTIGVIFEFGRQRKICAYCDFDN